jgi:hypothetical protein
MDEIFEETDPDMIIEQTKNSKWGERERRGEEGEGEGGERRGGGRGEGRGAGRRGK